ncbi:MAG: hypothetical protein RLZZ630_1212, partial [Bacteroidota bacterium]
MKHQLIILLLLVGLSLAGCKKENDDSVPVLTIPICGLLSLTGDWSSLGITSKAALEIAVEEVNAEFAANNLPYRFTLSI